jgi:hypothetical protein
MQRPTIGFVPNKSQEQADIQWLYRIRRGYIVSKKAVINWAI